MQLLPQYLEAIREHVEPFLETGPMTEDQRARAEAKMAEIIKREAVNFYPQHIGSIARDGVAHAIRFYNPRKERRLSDLPEGDEKDELRRAKQAKTRANGNAQAIKLHFRYGTPETLTATKATITFGMKNLERNETPKEAAELGKGPSWEEFLEEYRTRLAAQKPDAA